MLLPWQSTEGLSKCSDRWTMDRSAGLCKSGKRKTAYFSKQLCRRSSERRTAWLVTSKKIFDFSHKYGVDIEAAEFMNEPNMPAFSGALEGYTAANYARDQDMFFSWVRENYPNCQLVGPCTTGDPSLKCTDEKSMAAEMARLISACTTQELLNGTAIQPNVFSYHFYNGVSERAVSVMPKCHWSSDVAHSKRCSSVKKKAK